MLVNGAWGIEYPRPVPPLIQMVGPMIIDEDLSNDDQVTTFVLACYHLTARLKHLLMPPPPRACVRACARGEHSIEMVKQ
jgi:hypothetical protein